MQKRSDRPARKESSGRPNGRSWRPIPTSPTSPNAPTFPRERLPSSRSGRARSSPAPRATGGSTSPRSTRTRARLRHGLPGRRRHKGFVPTVFDNLIAKKEMPVTVGIFINPGTFDDEPVEPELRVRHAFRPIRPVPSRGDPARGREDGQTPPRRRRPGDRRDPAAAASAPSRWPGSGPTSSEGAFLGRPFTNIASGKTGREGGHNYEAMIRKTPKKPIRVFLQDGSSDLDNNNGNWPLANQTAGQVAGVHRLRLQVRLRPGLPQRQARPGDPARLAPLALARVGGGDAQVTVATENVNYHC